MESSHRRLNMLTGEWVQVSPGRTRRPWQGRVEEQSPAPALRHDPACYLCPGNERAGGRRNPDYVSTFVFENDFSALKPDAGPGDGIHTHGLLVARPERGICRVVCFSPRHDLTLASMPDSRILEVVELWAEQYRELGAIPWVRYVQIFENKGEIMGCSNPHPHGQIWAQESIPDEPLKELKSQLGWLEKHGSTLLGDYLDLELEAGLRVVTANDHFVVLVPFWAFWPYETIVISRRAFARFDDMDEEEKEALAAIIGSITRKYDRLFNVSFPYSAGFHPAPTDGRPHPEWHFHMHFYPPLLRSATVKKFRVGYEMLAGPQRDLTAEFSAEILRNLPE